MRTLTEMIQVTRPGGRVLVLDTDWGTTAVNGADRQLTRRILDGFGDHITQGWVGRQLPGLFHRAGLHHLVVAAETSWPREASAATDRPCPQLAAGAVDQGAITAEEARRWLDQLAKAAETGTFLWATTGFGRGDHPGLLIRARGRWPYLATRQRLLPLAHRGQATPPRTTSKCINRSALFQPVDQ